VRTPRIFHPGPLHPGADIELAESAANHVGRVLRLQPGAPLTLFNGAGGEYAATVTERDRRTVRAAVGAHRAVERESALAITLIQGIAKGERMDYAIQKAVELGVTAIRPLFSERSVVRLDGRRLEKRQAHWQGIITSACEQCGRNRLPELHPATTLPEYLEEEPEPPTPLLLDPEAPTSLTETAPQGGQCTLMIGPEGGLSEAEGRRAAAHGFRGVRLGPRVLRTETAAVTALAVLQWQWGDLGRRWPDDATPAAGAAAPGHPDRGW